MVSNMNVEPRGDLAHSAISQSSVDCQMIQPKMDCNELSKKMLKLELNQRGEEEKGSFDLDEKGSDVSGVRSPKSPFSNSSRFYVFLHSFCFRILSKFLEAH